VRKEPFLQAAGIRNGVGHNWIKVKLFPCRHTGAKRVRKYNSYLFLISALDGASGQHHVPAALFSQEKEAGWAPELGWTQRLEDETPVVQSVVRHCTD
jgi:hypothetical protein